MTLSIFVPTALQLYEYGLNRIFNSHWVDFNMKHMINLHRSGKLHPTGLLQKTLPNGILYHLGLWLFNEYFLENLDFFIDLEPKEIYTYLQHHLYLLGKGGCDVTSQEFLDLIMLIDDINDIGFDKPYSKFNSLFRRRQYPDEACNVIDSLRYKHRKDYKDLAKIYALNFAERVFHDREYCEFIAYVISSMYDYAGIPFLDDHDLLIIRPVSRAAWPSWILPTLRSRERGRCAKCGKSFDELEGEPQIDHIIPLASGGFNDIVNLQLLCENCNKSKGASSQRVLSSIPNYLQWHKSMRRHDSE